MSAAKHTYCGRTILRQAWAAARHDAAIYGGQSRHYLPEALRQAWARAVASREMRGRLIAQVEMFRLDQQPLARRRREREHAAFMAELDADMERVAAMGRVYAARYLQPAVEEDAA
ncbi:MAG: hypothetical protein K0S35_978 [Geminicoccaceae bacterium]|jgi:hypothetical protein|nr:hypothetical protein [Geminicoccaceae bacterium]